jgi:hypothetical protein
MIHLTNNHVYELATGNLFYLIKFKKKLMNIILKIVIDHKKK